MNYNQFIDFIFSLPNNTPLVIIFCASLLFSLLFTQVVIVLLSAFLTIVEYIKYKAHDNDELYRCHVFFAGAAINSREEFMRYREELEIAYNE